MKVEFDVSGVEIKSDRLLLREWRQSDLDDLYEYASVEGVGEMAGWMYHHSKAESQLILSGFLQEKNVFAIEHNSKVIGSIALHGSWAHKQPKYDNLKIAEIGYVLSKNYWGQGLMPEAVTALINYCFEILKLDALTICHFLANHQSQRVIEKCGFVFVDYGRFYSRQTDITYDEKRYILFRKTLF